MSGSVALSGAYYLLYCSGSGSPLPRVSVGGAVSAWRCVVVVVVVVCARCHSMRFGWHYCARHPLSTH